MKNRNKSKIKVLEPEVLEDLERADEYLDLVDEVEAIDVQQLLPATVAPTSAANVLDSLEKAGFGVIVAKVRELQGKKGSEAIRDTVARIERIEARIDELLATEDLLGQRELASLASSIESLYMLRAKILLIPVGAIHPRNMIPKVQVTVGNMQNNIGVPGTKVQGRQKS